MATKNEDMSDMQKQELEDSTSCGICMEIYRCPKLLLCGHTFCMNCIQETGLRTRKGPGDEMPCPICQQQFKIPSKGFDDLQNNYYIEGLIRVAQSLDPSVAALLACDSCLDENREEAGKEVPRADMYCPNCMLNLCEECCKQHRKFILTKNHKLLSISGNRQTDEGLIQSQVSSVCKLHKQEDLKIYCCECKTDVCSSCFFENQEGHKGTHVTKAVDDFRQEFANYVEKVKICISQAEMKKSELTKAKQDASNKLEGLQSRINVRKDCIMQTAEKHANSLLEDLVSIRQSMLKEIQIETDDIDTQLMRLESYNSYCKKIMTKGSASDISGTGSEDLSARVNELQEVNQTLTEQKLKPVTLCFIETEFKEEDGGNMIGQLKEQVHPKQITKTKESLIEELRKEIETQKIEIKAKETENEVLKVANEMLKRSLDKNEYTNSDSKLKQELENEKLINTTLQNQIENLIEQLKPEKMTTTPLHADKDKLLTEGNQGYLKMEENGQRNLIEKKAKYQEPTKSSCLRENQATDLEQDRICALMILPSVDIDEDIFYYLFRCQNLELSRISHKCNVFEQYKVGKKHKLAFDVTPYHKTDSVIGEFQKLCDQTTFDCVKIPGGVDLENLRNVEVLTEFKDVELRFMSQERVCKIVGSYWEITRAKQILLDVIASEMNQGCEVATNRKDQLNAEMTITSKGKKPTKSVPSYPTTTIDVRQARRSVFKVLNQSHDSLLLSVSNSLTIEVKHGDLTKMSNIDVLVSCMNHQLDVDGPMADQIMRAAGPYVRTELLSHKSRLSSLRTGCLVHTSAGHLTGVKFIIHVVRPQVNEFPSSDHRSRDVLRNVFTNCFRSANDELKLKSIHLPPIGIGCYGAIMVVDSFMDAVQKFASTVGNPSAATQHQLHLQPLNTIQLVSNDLLCIGQLIQCIKQRIGTH